MVLDALGGDENNALIRMLRAGPNEFMGKWNEAGSFTLLTEQTKRDFIEIEQNIGKIQVALNSIGLEMLQGLAPAIKGFLTVWPILRGTRRHAIKLPILLSFLQLIRRQCFRFALQ